MSAHALSAQHDRDGKGADIAGTRTDSSDTEAETNKQAGERTRGVERAEADRQTDGRGRTD